MTSAIMVAAGKGTRMGSAGDKLLLDLAGRPVAAHTWQRLDAAPCIDEVVLVVRSGMESVFRDLARDVRPQKPFVLVAGGMERQHSVWNGLQAVRAGAEIVAIQDAARPCTPVGLIAATVEAARQCGAAVAAQRVTDTIKETDDGRFIGRHLDRSRLWAVQTPQTFRVGVIRRALEAVRQRGLAVTDDTAACELIGQPVRLVECLEPNPKVTVPSDLPLIAALLAR
ncbi:MAG: 2-C-methyl-D-erythritol 4-phosphate cytidylyltransferase [Verrucomicrobia bacterium]|nr:2-C-methyl-D-erythritol 4-phosphate cytidylyltransferase [Verrucomicrobiota bacterium]